MKTLIIILIYIFFINNLFSQTSDDQYKKPLSDVLIDVQNRFGINLKYSEEQVAGKWITYAEWRYRPDVETTLSNILAPVDLTFKKEGENLYKIKKYEYYRWSLEDGKKKAEYLATLYNDSTSWEKRKKELTDCMWKAIGLKGIPEWPLSKPIITQQRKMNGYDIENIALEVLPGVYTFGSIYKPSVIKEKIPIILCPNGHWLGGRYRPDHQIRCAMLARMGAISISYDLFAWGESQLQFKEEYHRNSMAMTIQVLNSLRILDYLISLNYTDNERIAIIGGSGGGSHSMLITALDKRIKVSVPTVMLSCFMYGGCPCESGKPIHLCGNGTNNVELSAMAAPRPQLIISDGKDWTANVPEIEYPLVNRIYSFYGMENIVVNKHFANEGHDFGPSKRLVVYPFIAEYLKLDITRIVNKKGEVDESKITVEDKKALYVLDNDVKNLPENAILNFEDLLRVFNETIK